MAPVLKRNCSVSLVMGPRYACIQGPGGRVISAHVLWLKHCYVSTLPPAHNSHACPAGWLRTLLASIKYHDASPCFCGTQRPGVSEGVAVSAPMTTRSAALQLLEGTAGVLAFEKRQRSSK
jgi:hypothetical protein